MLDLGEKHMGFFRRSSIEGVHLMIGEACIECHILRLVSPLGERKWLESLVLYGCNLLWADRLSDGFIQTELFCLSVTLMLHVIVNCLCC